MPSFVACLLGCFLLGEALHRLGSSAETSRKAVHLGSCLAVAFYPHFGMDRLTLALVACGSLLALATLRSSKLLRSINTVTRRTWGDLLLPLSVLILAALGVSPRTFVAAYVLLGVADSAASMFGSRYGKTRLPWLNSKKTWIGSAAFLACCILLMLVPPITALGAPIASAWLLVAFALSLTCVEAVCSLGTDNLFIPVFVAVWLDAVAPKGALT